MKHTMGIPFGQGTQVLSAFSTYSGDISLRSVKKWQVLGFLRNARLRLGPQNARPGPRSVAALLKFTKELSGSFQTQILHFLHQILVVKLENNLKGITDRRQDIGSEDLAVYTVSRAVLKTHFPGHSC